MQFDKIIKLLLNYDKFSLFNQIFCYILNWPIIKCFAKTQLLFIQLMRYTFRSLLRMWCYFLFLNFINSNEFKCLFSLKWYILYHNMTIFYSPSKSYNSMNFTLGHAFNVTLFVMWFLSLSLSLSPKNTLFTAKVWSFSSLLPSNISSEAVQP